MKFLIINGPNLNLMHFTEPGVAGQIDYNALLDYLEVCCSASTAAGTLTW